MPLKSLVRITVIVMLSAVLIAFSLTSINNSPVEAHVSIETASLSICFVNEGQTACVDRPAPSAPQTITREVRLLTQFLIAGPTNSERASGAQSSLPPDTQLGAVTVNDEQVIIHLILSDTALKALTDQQVEDINEQFRTTFTPYNFQQIEIDARGSNGAYHLLSDFLPKVEIPHKLPPPLSTSLPLTGEGRGGGLSNKTVFVSAGHGWAWNTTLNSFKTQRPVYPSSPPYPAGEGIVEDFNNAEAVNQYLLQYLYNAGADAWTVRERDMNTNMIVVDDGSAAFSTQGNWLINSGGYNGTYRSTSTVNAAPTATATWTFTPSATSIYAVYIRFPGTATTSVVDARFFVAHAGAVTPVTLTQARNADTWRFIGRYPFYAGQPARLFVTNQSNTPDVTVLADAIRIGGGIGDTSVADAPISNKPRWEEQSRQYAKWDGMPNVDNTNDVIVRPIYSEWEKDPGEDSVYISWHTNGYNGYNTTIRGTESYIYLTPTINSTLLQDAVHTQLLSEIHSGWDSSWPDRGEKRDDLGEVRLLSTMPGLLLENGFHDNPTDVDALKDPRFNQLSARAIYHGLVHYWHALDPNVPLTFLPEPPQQVMARNDGAGRIKIEWQPGPTDGSGPLGDAATAYRAYTSTDGFGWSNPIDVSSTALTLTGLTSNQLVFIQVTGVNEGGESFPSPVLAARVSGNGPAPILIVYGFDRIDRAGDTQQNDPLEGVSRRMFVDRINRFDAIIQHADAITLPFDSVQQATVSNNAIGLGNYTIVDWIAGEEQTPFPSLTTNDQTALTSFLNNGGALFISGSDIAYDLRATTFLATTLRASYSNDDAQTYSANPTTSGIFNGLGAINFDDGTHGTYHVDSADVINPVNGASSALVYNTASAAVQYASNCTRLVYSAVPFETIYPQSTRRAVMDRLIGFLGKCLPTNLRTTIVSPLDGAFVNAVPPFNGGADSTATQVQVSIRRVNDGFFYNGSSFSGASEAWLAATGVDPWNYVLPALNDGAYALRARMVAPGPIVDPSPAAITFTLDTVAPNTPAIITPTNGVSLTAVAPVLEWTGGGSPSGFTIELDGHTTTLTSPALSAALVVTDGLHLWRVRAFDRAGNLSSWSNYGTFRTSSLKSHLPLIFKSYAAPEPPQVTCYEAIANGGFESGTLSGWAIGAANPPPQVIAAPVYSGLYAVRVGAAGTTDPIAQAAYSSVQQSISLPIDVITATLSFARYRYSGDTSDLQYVAVLDGSSTNYLVFDRVHDLQWVPGTFDLRDYAGQTITVRWGVYNNGSGGTTGMAVDEVHAGICAPR